MSKAAPLTDSDGVEYIRPSELEGNDLGEHEGIPIVDTRATITGADGFLCESLRLSGGVHLPLGRRGFLCIPFQVDSHEYDPMKVKGERNFEELVETGVLKAEGGFLLDPDIVHKAAEVQHEAVNAYRAKVERERKEAAGTFELPFDAPDEDTATIHNLRDQAVGDA